MPQAVSTILEQYVNDVQRIYGDKLESILLYGSYARGDFRDESDIDILILVDLTEEEIWNKGHSLSDLTFDYNYDHDLAIMPLVKNQAHFNKWIQAYPLYNIIRTEGVELYAV